MSAVNMTLPAFAAECHAVAPLLLNAGACCSRLLLAERWTANPPHTAAMVDRWNRQEDGRTDGPSTVS